MGTSIFFRSSVRSVSENALTQSYAALMPTLIDISQNASLAPAETVDPSRLAP